ncbi:DnaB-like helicase C-terminal domain-containing protein [Bartonella sp. HY038]|uniref:replicative DNA helicase n=1 Tax=Bartonella sp. HY038 TaxID=2759660 RepID=UPI0015F8BB64|nr:DnaB-like helicase C-terminal domain-containing protein [Bartonella sp. HY038]
MAEFSNASVNQNAFIPEIEQDLLGGCLLETECFIKASAILSADNFIEPLHQSVFNAMQRGFDTYQSTTLPIIVKGCPQGVEEQLKARGFVNWAEYLVRLTMSTITRPGSVEERAMRVLEQWGRVQLSDHAQNIAIAAQDPLASLQGLVSSTVAAFDDILVKCRKSTSSNARTSLSRAMQSAFIAARKAASSNHGLTGLNWGLVDLNAITGGIQKRDLILIGARPSMGKTTFATAIARAVAKSGKHGVGIISLEMDKDKLAARMASDIAFDKRMDIPYTHIINGKIALNDLEQMEEICQAIGNLPILIDDQSGITIAQIRAKVEAMKAEFIKGGAELSVLIIDHLGLIRASNRYSGNRNNEIAEMTATLKAIARDFDIAVVVLSQLNREVEKRGDKRPQLSDLRDSGAIEQDADTIMFLHREAYYLDREKYADFDKESARVERLIDTQNTMEIIVAKQRNGPLKTIGVFADMACAAIRNGARP